MRILLLNDTSAWYHWGCTGTSLALKEYIQDLGFELITVPINETYNCKNTPETVVEFKDPNVYDRFCKLNASLIEQLKLADIIILNGEGTIHGLSHGARTLLYLAYISKVYLKKVTYIINHSVYPQDSLILDDPLTIELYQMVYRLLDFVAVRELFSANLMKQLKIEVTQSFDCLPLFIRDHYICPKKLDRKTLVVAGSATWFKEDLFEQFKPALVNLIQYINHMITQGFTVQVLIGAKAYPAKDDQKFIAYLNANKAQGWTLIDAKSIEEWLDTIAQASLLLSGRFHHTIAAMCLRTPYIALKSNTPKIDAILNMFSEDTAVSWNSPDLFNELDAKTKSILKNSEKCFMKFSLDELCELSMENFAGLNKFELRKTLFFKR